MLEKDKFKEQDQAFHDYIEKLLEMKPAPKDLIHHFPIFTGWVNLARHLFFYEMYKKTLGVSGHICEIGTWTGASFLFFAKLVRIFEPHATTQVHGFDWFKGMQYSDQRDADRHQGDYGADYQTLCKMIEMQGLEGEAVVHNMDVAEDLPSFLEDHPSLHFKLVFLDCPVYAVLETCLRELWPRMNQGAIMLFDHANSQSVPQEQRAVREILGDVSMRTWPHTRTPTGYLVKE